MKQAGLYLLFSLLLTPLVQAKTLTGQGYAPTMSQAKERALSDLASAVQVEVKSASTSVCAKNNGTKTGSRCSFEQEIHTQADLPLLGVQYQDIPTLLGEKGKSALLDSGQVLRLYKAELDTLHGNIRARAQALKQTTDKDNRYRLLHQQLAEVREYHKHRLVAAMLSAKQIPEAPINEAQLSAQILDLEKSADSLPFAARLLTKGIKAEAIYIYPPRHRDAVEVTPFAAALRSALATHLNTVARTDKARYVMKGEYDILKNNDIHIHYQLLDRHFKIHSTRSVRLIHAGWKAYRAMPQAPDLDQLLHQGMVVSNEFRASLSTDRGSSDLLFCKGDTITLVAKMNRSGYFYIVGHVIQGGKEFSYLLDLNDADGPYRFMRYVPPEEVNRLIELNEFRVSAPFGMEHLQMIAADENLKDRLPRSRWDEKLGYFVIKNSLGNARRGVSYTRGLKPLRPEAEKHSFEAKLSFTTMPDQNICQQ